MVFFLMKNVKVNISVAGNDGIWLLQQRKQFTKLILHLGLGDMRRLVKIMTCDISTMLAEKMSPDRTKKISFLDLP